MIRQLIFPLVILASGCVFTGQASALGWRHHRNRCTSATVYRVPVSTSYRAPAYSSVYRAPVAYSSVYGAPSVYGSAYRASAYSGAYRAPRVSAGYGSYGGYGYGGYGYGGLGSSRMGYPGFRSSGMSIGIGSSYGYRGIGFGW
ncbi:hypothetical protein NHH03_26220 [Stieleria sp. TO1_6]|uniref:hypothetical protein n=1 Tax=Stieleria tagensis TaxID=2956795 RepID=UPI00209B8A5F|nr:hypothetical protein [Stieleria tagensis]MCO8125261.1 hypothetical protein [Stieleria tagensis]